MRRTLALLISSLAFATTACGGGGTDSKNTKGTFTVTDETEGDVCPDGGQKIQAAEGSTGTTIVYACAGKDATTLGASPEERGENCEAGGVRLTPPDGPPLFVCNGLSGTSADAGASGEPVVVTAEPKGDNCPAGGYKLSSGGTINYVCNGKDGVVDADSGTVAASVAITPELSGQNCPSGGLKLESAGGTGYVCNAQKGADGQGVVVTVELVGDHCQFGGYALQSATGTNYVCNGASGTNGQSVAITAEMAGTNCSFGGYKLQTATGVGYVCNGADGNNGQSVAVTPEVAGTNCQSGGYKLQSANGTSYVCNGTNGTPGQSVAVTLEIAGTNCQNGGYKLQSASGIGYVCNGAAGTNGQNGQSVAVTPEAPGGNCQNGGYKLQSTTGTNYVCNGTDGGSISVTTEAPGVRCPAGGYRLTTSSGSYYVCNGMNGSNGSGGSPDGGTPVSTCQDADNDGYFTGCSDYTTIPGPDCDDADPTVYQWQTGYADQDGDGYTVGAGRTVCIGPVLPPTYRATPSAVTDCNDADPDIWSTCATCIDNDGDGAYANCDAWTRHAGPDCDDNDPWRSSLLSEIPNDGRDNDCAGDGDLVAAAGNGVFVATTGKDTNAGTPSAPMATIAAAINLATSNGTSRVYVAKGTYTVAVTSSVSIFGGYEATNWTRDLTNNITSLDIITLNGAQPVTVDGVSSPSIVIRTTGDRTVITRNVIASPSSISYGIDAATTNHGVVVAAGNTITSSSSYYSGIRIGGTTDATLIGNSIQRGGTASVSDFDGIYIESGTTTLAVRNTVDLTNNTTVSRSYGVYTTGSRVRLDRNVIRSGSGTTLVGLDIRGGVVTATGNTIIGGATSGSSYGISHSGGAAYLVGNVILDGPGSYFEGYYVNSPGSSHFLNNVIRLSQTTSGRGVDINASGLDASVMNNVIQVSAGQVPVHLNTSAASGNVPTGRFFANNLYAPPGACLMDSTQALSTCLVDIDDVNNCAKSICIESSANLSVSPGFVDPANSNFHLQTNSLLIDRGFDPVAGDSFGLVDRSRGPLGAISLYAASLAIRDLDGNTRPAGAHWDIGIDECR